MRKLTGLLLVTLLACSADHPTFGEACTDVGTALCNRALVCGKLQTNEATCQGKFVLACCGGPPNICTKESDAEQRQIDDCTEALHYWDCEAIDKALPPACLGAT